MIFDLDKIDGKMVCENPNVLIIGAGTAGLYLADKLSTSGLNVVLVDQGESIGSNPDKDSVINLGMPYKGSYKGRSFGLGGTSTLWGGQMIPLSESDFEDRCSRGVRKWAIKYQDLIPYFKKVCRSLDLHIYDNQSLDALQKRFFPKIHNLGGEFHLRLSQWIPFGKRNFGKYYCNKISRNKHSTVKIWLNATVQKIVKSKETDDYKITKVVSRSPSGKLLSIDIDRVVLCAGALESTRLLLEFEDDNPDIQVSPALGLFFSDHLSVNLGEIIPQNFRDVNLTLAPIFYKGIMHTPRLELSDKYQRINNTPSSFVHFSFITKGNTFFDFVRDILRSKQDLRKPKDNYSVLFVFQSIFGLISMFFWRVFYRRLKFPNDSKVLVQVDFEQLANKESIVKLSDERGEDNRKKLILDWRLVDKEERAIHKTLKNVTKLLSNSGLSECLTLESSLNRAGVIANNIHDVYHPTGTISMGINKQRSVVDTDLKLHGCLNLYVSSTAVFPSPGSANPGMTHLALTDRLGDFLLKNRRSIV